MKKFTLLLIIVLGTLGAQKLDPNNPEDAVRIMRRIQASEVEGEEAVYWWYGNAYSRIPGEKDRLLFKFHGMNIRASQTIKDPKKGKGYRHVSRELLFYLDPKNEELLREWKNPFTNETVDVIHVANDPVNSYGTFPKGRRGPYSLNGMKKGDKYFMNIQVPLFYTNPLGGPNQEIVGGKYHAVEMFNFVANYDEMVAKRTKSAKDVVVGWTRVAQWLPWMKMGDKSGTMYFHGVGRKLNNYDELPDFMKNIIDEYYPLYKEAPPITDKRKNETSWTYYKKILNGEVSNPVKK